MKPLRDDQCPICRQEKPKNARTCKECGEILKANPHLCVTDLM